MPTYVVQQPFWRSWWLYAIVVIFGIIGFFYVWHIAIDQYCRMDGPVPEEDQGLILRNGTEYQCGGIEKDGWNATVKCTHFCRDPEMFTKQEVFVYR